MAEPVVLLDRPAPHVARLLINRPDKRNAIDFEVREQMVRPMPVTISGLQVRR